MNRVSLLLMVLVTLAGCSTTRPANQGGAFSTVAFSPDHSLLAFANASEIRVLSVETRSPVNTLRVPLPKNEVPDPAAFRHGVGDTLVFVDDRRIATTGMGGLFSIWDVRSGDRLAVIEAPADDVFASTLDYSPATGRLVIGTSAGEILLLTIDGDALGPLTPLAKLEGYVWDLQFGQEGRYFASASLTVRELGGGAGEGTGFDPAAGQISEGLSAAHESAQPMLINASNVAVWDAESLEKVGKLERANQVRRMALAPNERALVTAGREVQVWEFLTLEQAGEIRDPSMVLQGIGVGTMVAVSMLGVAAGAGFGTPLIAPDPFMAAQSLMVPAGLANRPEVCMRSVAISPDGKTVVTTTLGPSHNVMAVIDRARDKVVDKWHAAALVCDMEFSPDGKYLLTATNAGVLIYDTQTWKKTNLEDIASG
jgi:WD40 repeat protein